MDVRLRQLFGGSNSGHRIASVVWGDLGSGHQIASVGWGEFAGFGEKPKSQTDV